MRWGNAVFMGVLIAVVAAAFAIAAGSKSSKDVVLCAAKKGGDLTLAGKKGKCAKGEKKITVAKEGPRGPVGATGPQGAVGPAGSGAAPEAARLVGPASSACAINGGVFCVTESGTCYEYANAGGGLAPVAYRKDSDGFVHLEGALDNTNAGGACGGDPTFTAFYLPQGFRPAGGTQRFPAMACAGEEVGYVTVAPNGSVNVLRAKGGCFDLSGIVFHGA